MFFYGVYIKDETIRNLFDIARLILQPDFARKSHITLRGPYKKRPSKKSKFFNLELGEVYLGNPNVFFEGGQNTVYLKTEIIGIKEIWWKKDYPNGIPHFSIYDGNDRSFAWQVLFALREFDWNLFLELTPVTIIERKHNYHQSFLLEIDDIDKAFSQIAAKPLHREYIVDMPAGQRIYYLKKICKQILKLTEPQKN